MPEIRITLTDWEYERLSRVKGNKTWKQLLLELVPKSKEEELIENINKFAEKMKKEDPENHEVYEFIRVSLIMLIRGNIEKSSKLLDECIKVLRSKKR